MGDCTCFCILTPLVATSTYMCGQGAWYYFTHNESWTAFGLLVLSAFLWFVFVFWFVVTLTFHLRSWREWRDRNQLVKLVVNHRRMTSKGSTSSKGTRTTSDSDTSDSAVDSRSTGRNETCGQRDRDSILYVRMGSEQTENNSNEFEEVPL